MNKEQMQLVILKKCNEHLIKKCVRSFEQAYAVLCLNQMKSELTEQSLSEFDYVQLGYFDLYFELYPEEINRLKNINLEPLMGEYVKELFEDKKIFEA